MELRLPIMNGESVQRGLDALGDALAQQKQNVAQQEVAGATLAFRQKLNDRVNELSNGGDFSGDWGLNLRDYATEQAKQLGEHFSDAETFKNFQANMGLSVENQVNAFRQLQTQKAHDFNFSTVEERNKTAVDMAPQDLTTAALTLNTTWGAQVNVDPEAGAKFVKFNQSALSAYGGPAQALQKYQAVSDTIAASWAGAQIDKIMTDPGITWVDKQDQLSRLNVRYASALDSSGIHPTASTLTKLDDAMSAALTKAKTGISGSALDTASISISAFDSSAQDTYVATKVGAKVFTEVSGKAYPASAQIQIGDSVFTNAKNDNPARTALNELTKAEFHPEIFGQDRVDLATKLEGAALKYDAIRAKLWGGNVDEAVKNQVAQYKADWAFRPVFEKAALLAGLAKTSPLVASQLVDDAKQEPVQAPALKSMADAGWARLKDSDPAIRAVFADALNQAYSGYQQDVQTDPNKALINAQSRIKMAAEAAGKSNAEGAIAALVGIRNPQDLAKVAQDQKIVSDLFKTTAAGAAIKDSVYADMAEGIMANKAMKVALSLGTRVDAVGKPSWSDKDGYVFQATSKVGIPGSPGAALQTYRFNGDGNGIVSLDVMVGGKWTQAVANIDKPLDTAVPATPGRGLLDSRGRDAQISYWRDRLGGKLPAGKTDILEETDPSGRTFSQWLATPQAQGIAKKAQQ